MFISSTILAVLFFGAYNYPGMAWAVENWGVNIANIIGIAALFAKLCFSSFSTCGCDGLFKIQIRSIDAFRMEVLIPLSILNIIITGIVILRAEIFAFWDFNQRVEKLN
jgi:NADH-quinone oxidoreductase subunit H